MSRAPDAPDERDGAKIATIAAAVLGVVLSVLALVFFGGRAAASVLVGAVIAVSNLVMLRAIIRAILRPPEEDDEEGGGGGAAWGLFVILKILVLFGGVGLLLTKGLVDPIPLVVGYGVLPLWITASALIDSLAPPSRRRR